MSEQVTQGGGANTPSNQDILKTLNWLKQKIEQGSALSMYPVGSIYMSADANFNPNTAFGGTWVKIENRFLLGSGTRAVGTTGGEENVTLNINQIPSHTHNRGDMNINGNIYNNAHGGLYLSSDGVFTVELQNNGTGNGTGGGQMDTIRFNANRNWAGNVSWNGGGQSHNNMPPYLVIAIWKRTA